MTYNTEHHRSRLQRRGRLLAYRIYYQFRTFCIALVVCACILGIGTLIHGTSRRAAAAELVRAPQRLVEYVVNGTPIGLGVMGIGADGNNVYCVQVGFYDELHYGNVTDVSDSVDARKIAWLANHYQHHNDAITHAAIAVYIHDTLDTDSRHVWPAWRAEAMRQYPDLISRVQQVRAEADSHVASVARASVTYESGHRSGHVGVTALGTGGQTVAGVAYEVTLTGPAVFDTTGTATARGTSTTEAQILAWHATGNGTVQAHVHYAAPTLERLDSQQDYVRFKGISMAEGQGVSFDVDLKFQPLLRSQAVPHVIPPGGQVNDTVTSAIAQGDVWKAQTTVRAHGYYFAGMDYSRLNTKITPQAGESAQEFIARVQEHGYKLRAYGSAEFTHPEQSITVTAHTKPDPHSAVYQAHSSDQLGTWVWVIDPDRQPKGTQQWLHSGYISAFMDKTESTYSQRQVTIESTVTEHTATVGSSLTDTITVAGFPQDHGQFAGDSEAGLLPDQTRMQVSVYWAGSGIPHADRAAEEQYKPAGADPPAADDHHAVVGTWEYPAVNGTVRVGGGAPDSNNKPVHITAERAGYYVFVLHFSGDSRVASAQSRYDDAWERVWVHTNTTEPPSPPQAAQLNLVTHVNRSRLQVGDELYDVARISGDIPEGAYVTFSAFAGEAADVAEDTHHHAQSGASAILRTMLKEHRIALTDTQHVTRTTTADGVQVLTVTSPHIRAQQVGSVQWKATLWSPSGDVLASHELGLPEETTIVEEHPKPQQPPKPSENQQPSKPYAQQQLALTGSEFAGLVSVAVIVGCIGIGLQVIRHRKTAR